MRASSIDLDRKRYGMIASHTPAMNAQSPSFLRRTARVMLWATLLLLPLRLGWTLVGRERPPIYTGYTDFTLYTSDVTMLSMLAAWALANLRERRRPHLGPRWLTLALAGLTAAGLISTLVSIDPALSLYHTLRLVLLGAFYLYIVDEITSLAEVAGAIGLQVVTQTAVGAAQFWGQRSLGLTQLGEHLLDPGASGVSVVVADGVRVLRAYGLTDHPNLLGGCLAFGLILIGGAYAQTQSRWRWLGIITFAIGALGLFVTFSRAAWLALAAGVTATMFILWRSRRKVEFARWAQLSVAALIVVTPLAWGNRALLGVRFNANGSFAQVATENRSLAERGALASAANQVIASHPLLGVGLGTLPLAIQQLHPIFPYFYQPAHNTLIDATAETGAFGALFWLGALALPWFALWRNRRTLTNRPGLIAASGLLLAVSAVGFFDYYTWLLAPGRLWQWLAWGLWAVEYQRPFEERLHA